MACRPRRAPGRTNRTPRSPNPRTAGSVPRRVAKRISRCSRHWGPGARSHPPRSQRLHNEAVRRECGSGRSVKHHAACNAPGRAADQTPRVSAHLHLLHCPQERNTVVSAQAQRVRLTATCDVTGDDRQRRLLLGCAHGEYRHPDGLDARGPASGCPSADLRSSPIGSHKNRSHDA